jgi:hypothetical protein
MIPVHIMENGMMQKKTAKITRYNDCKTTDSR